MGDWSTLWSNCQPTIRGSWFWIWTNLQNFIWKYFKQHAVCSYNQKLHSLHLLEFFYNDFKFVGLVKVVGALQTHLLCIAPCYVLWKVWNFYSFPILEWWWSLSLVGSFYDFHYKKKGWFATGLVTGFLS